MWRRLALIIAVAQFLSVAAPASVGRTEKDDVDRTFSAPAGFWLTVKPPLGLVSAPIRQYVTDLELSVVADIQSMINGLELSVEVPLKNQGVSWYVEPVLATSPTFELQKSVLFAMNRVIDGRIRLADEWPLSIVVGRTQKFIQDTLEKLNCRPNLDRFGGVILMGASVCGRHVIVSNITGYLFLLRADQVLTARLEARREKPIAETPYRVVARNVSALAHEFVHIWRAVGLSGVVPADEPAWFSEGFAEFWAGVGLVLSRPRRVNYLTQHVVRVRDFSDWAHQCTEPLAVYRRKSEYANGCEYHVGLIAVEYLYARYSTLETTLSIFEKSTQYASFEETFVATFGITLDEFEREATRYIENLRKAERLG